jgi:hypothetical protein
MWVMHWNSQCSGEIPAWKEGIKENKKALAQFRNPAVRNRRTIHNIVNKLREIGSLLGRKEQNQNNECSLTSNRMKSVLGLNVLLENPSDA